jgi:hypothetical protein
MGVQLRRQSRAEITSREKEIERLRQQLEDQAASREPVHK